VTEKKKGRAREPITQSRIDQIVLLIQAWDPKKTGTPSGPKLEKKVLDELGIELSYPGMFKHQSIKDAFEERKAQIVSGKPPKRPPSPEIQLLQQRIERQGNEIRQLKDNLASFQELFVRHHYNAKARGMTVPDLEAPIPALSQYDADDLAKGKIKR
jgi:hypothetical protein